MWRCKEDDCIYILKKIVKEMEIFNSIIPFHDMGKWVPEKNCNSEEKRVSLLFNIILQLPM